MTTTKPRLLYFESQGFQPANLIFMAEQFELITLSDPSAIDPRAVGDIAAACAPMGYAFDREMLAPFSSLQVLITPTTGILHIDTDYIREKGIHICSLKDQQAYLSTITPTAELAWGLLLAVTRYIPAAFETVKAGAWNGKQFGIRTPRMLSAMNLGIIGLGRLGRLMAAYGQAFQMPVRYFDPYQSDDRYIRCDTLLELARKSDIISVHVHLNTETENMVDTRFISEMPPGGFIINTARGGIVNESALLENLQSGHLAGAGLDMLAKEHLPGFRVDLAHHPLVAYAREHDNLVLTPKMGGATQDAWIGTERRVLELALVELRKRGIV